MAIAADGSFVVVWHSYGDDGSFLSIQGQHYDAGGAPLGNQFQVNTYTTDGQFWPKVATTGDGGFVVV